MLRVETMAWIMAWIGIRRNISLHKATKREERRWYKLVGAMLRSEFGDRTG
jgi:hypothetical protein